jgi:hypothetical protein
MITGKHIGTEIAPSDATTSDELERGPPLSPDKHVLAQPVRNSLLAYADAFTFRRRVVPKKLSKPVSKLVLPAGNLDSTLERGNVVSLHGPSLTRNRVDVNKVPRLTEQKGSCTVLHMPTTKKKPVRATGARPTTARKADPIVGPDGFTMSQRVLRLMAENSMSQAGLARACSDYYSAFIPGDSERVKQQHIFNIIQGQDSSWVVPLIAGVFDVSVLWLQFGIGKREHKPH